MNLPSFALPLASKAANLGAQIPARERAYARWQVRARALSQTEPAKLDSKTAAQLSLAQLSSAQLSSTQFNSTQPNSTNFPLSCRPTGRFRPPVRAAALARTSPIAEAGFNFVCNCGGPISAPAVLDKNANHPTSTTTKRGKYVKMGVK